MQGIVIFGQGKTGTTALFHKIRASHPATRTYAQFEPREFSEPANQSEYDYSLTKLLLRSDSQLDYSLYNHFDKKIYVVRDPRDWIISKVLYAMRGPLIARDPKSIAAVLNVLRQKESAPQTTSFYALLEAFANHSGQTAAKFVSWIRNQQIWLRGFECTLQDVHILRYEHLVDDHLTDLEAFLELPLHAGDAQPPLKHQKVIRTKSYNNWKNWFLDSDVAFFEPLFRDYIDRHGYGIDWSLNPDPIIDPAHGSDYVRKNMLKLAQ